MSRLSCHADLPRRNVAKAGAQRRPEALAKEADLPNIRQKGRIRPVAKRIRPVANLGVERWALGVGR
jgi:hypothetical protein